MRLTTTVNPITVETITGSTWIISDGPGDRLRIRHLNPAGERAEIIVDRLGANVLHLRGGDQ